MAKILCYEEEMISLILLFLSHPASALELGASTSFQIAKEQVKSASGDSNGALFTHQQLGGWVSALVPVAESIKAGGFVHYEHGKREMCDYSLSSGVPTPISCNSGSYNQFWIGPTGRVEWKAVFFEASYVLFGIRGDTAYSNLYSNGSTETLRTHPLKAWVFTPGVFVDLGNNLHLNLKLEYRYLYYSRVGGGNLPNDQLFGTQAIRPQIGLSWFM